MPKRKNDPEFTLEPSRELPSRRVKTESQQKKDEKRKQDEEKKQVLSSPTKRTPRRSSVVQLRFPEATAKEIVELVVDGHHSVQLLTRVQLPCPLQKVTEFQPFRDWLRELETSIQYHHTLHHHTTSVLATQNGDLKTPGVRVILDGTEYLLKKIDVQVVDWTGTRILFTKMKVVFSKINEKGLNKQEEDSLLLKENKAGMEVEDKVQNTTQEKQEERKQEQTAQDPEKKEQETKENQETNPEKKGDENGEQPQKGQDQEKKEQEEEPKPKEDEKPQILVEEEEAEDDEIIERVVFLRGGAVGVLVILYANNEASTILTVQPRIPAGHFNLPELPAGMLDGSGNFSGVAAKELEEETGIKINEKDLIDLTGIAHSNEPKKQRGVYPSPSNCDEFLRLFAYKKQISHEKLHEIQGKLSGLRDHGELITLRVIPFKHLWTEAPDAKALSALALLRGIEERDGPFPILPL